MTRQTRNSKRSSSPSSATAVPASRSAKVLRCVVPTPDEQWHPDGLVVVAPPLCLSPEGVAALKIFDSLVKFLKQNKEMLDNILEDKNNQLVRGITGDRYEILYEKYPKQFDDVLKKSSDPVLHDNGVSVTISTFSKAQFYEDTRYEHNYVFGTCTLLLSFGVNYAQPIHIDLRLPNVQFVVTMTNGTPLTEVSTLKEDNEGQGRRSVDGLIAHWKKIFGNEIPPAVLKCLRNSDKIRDLMKFYGHLLAPKELLCMLGPRTGQKRGYAAGTAAILPGSIPHRAPKSTKFRAVIFGTARPPNEGTDYDQNGPFFVAPGLVIEILQKLWNKREIDRPERVFLLQMLSHQLLKFSEDKSHNEDLSNHYDKDTDIEQFLAKVKCIHKRGDERGEGMNGKDEKDMEELIETAAKIAPHEFQFCNSVTDSDQSDSGM